MKKFMTMLLAVVFGISVAAPAVSADDPFSPWGAPYNLVIPNDNGCVFRYSELTWSAPVEQPNAVDVYEIHYRETYPTVTGWQMYYVQAGTEEYAPIDLSLIDIGEVAEFRVRAKWGPGVFSNWSPTTVSVMHCND